jgi:hypothetical protein
MVATAYAPSYTTQSRPVAKGIADDYYDEVGDAVDRDKYYAGVKDTFEKASGAELYQSLNKLVSKGVRDLGYSGARKELYKSIDRRPDGNLYYLYSGEGTQEREGSD